MQDICCSATSLVALKHARGVPEKGFPKWSRGGEQSTSRFLFVTGAMRSPESSRNSLAAFQARSRQYSKRRMAPSFSSGFRTAGPPRQRLAEQGKTALKALKPFLPAGIRVHRRLTFKQERCEATIPMDPVAPGPSCSRSKRPSCTPGGHESFGWDRWWYYSRIANAHGC